MDKQEFAEIRNRLGKTQKELSQLLGISLKAVQSFEQGWRNIPGYVERHMFFLWANQRTGSVRRSNCWTILKCPKAVKKKCPAFEFNSGQLCWFINGTICNGKVQDTWEKKMETCRDCEVFKMFINYLTIQN